MSKTIEQWAEEIVDGLDHAEDHGGNPYEYLEGRLQEVFSDAAATPRAVVKRGQQAERDRDNALGLYRGAVRVFQALAEDDRPMLSTVNEDYQQSVDAVVGERIGLRETVAKQNRKLDEAREVLGEHLDDVRRRRAFLNQALELGERFKKEIDALLEHHGLKP